jgi:hypothetical protein
MQYTSLFSASNSTSRALRKFAPARKINLSRSPHLLWQGNLEASKLTVADLNPILDIDVLTCNCGSLISKTALLIKVLMSSKTHLWLTYDSKIGVNTN